jgi:hypothetical protein
VVGQGFVEVVPDLPADAQMVGGHAHQLSLRAEPLEERSKLELEEEDWIDRWTSVDGIAVFDPVPYYREIERTLKMARDVVNGNERLEGDGDRAVELAARTGAKHGGEAFLWRRYVGAQPTAL